MKLPKLFKEIIKHDKERNYRSGNVLGLPEYKEWRKRKLELMRSAEDFIKRQRAS